MGGRGGRHEGRFERAWWQTFVYVFFFSVSLRNFKGQRPSVSPSPPHHSTPQSPGFASTADWKHIAASSVRRRVEAGPDGSVAREGKEGNVCAGMHFSLKETITFNQGDISSFGFTYVHEASSCCA